jgi:anti-anti-sigma factor
MAQQTQTRLFKVQDARGVLVARCQVRKLRDEPVVRLVARVLRRLARARSRPHIVLNFRKVEYISSLMVARLLQLAERVRKAEGRLVLCGLQPKVAEVCALVGLDREIDIYPDKQQAWASFASAAAAPAESATPG